MSRIYSGSNYQMGGLGAAQIGGQLGAAPDTLAVTGREKVAAEAEIKKMRSALARWLKYRALLGVPLSEFTATEVRLGQRLYVLLSEMFDAQALPAASNVTALARAAVSGKLSSEIASNVTSHIPMSGVWMWPAVAVVGLVLMTVVVKIKSDADSAADERRTECIKAGKCTDTGFWLKVGGIALVAWLAWDKFGLKKMVEGKTG